MSLASAIGTLLLPSACRSKVLHDRQTGTRQRLHMRMIPRSAGGLSKSHSRSCQADNDSWARGRRPSRRASSMRPQDQSSGQQKSFLYSEVAYLVAVVSSVSVLSRSIVGGLKENERSPHDVIEPDLRFRTPTPGAQNYMGAAGHKSSSKHQSICGTPSHRPGP